MGTGDQLNSTHPLTGTGNHDRRLMGLSWGQQLGQMSSEGESGETRRVDWLTVIVDEKR